MVTIVIESPYRGKSLYDTERNKRFAKLCMRHSIDLGEAPFASHLLYTQCLDDDIKEERETGIKLRLVWGMAARKVAVYTNYGVSEGMQYGISYWKELGKEIEFRVLPEAYLFRNVEYTLEGILYDISVYFKLTEDVIQSKSRKIEHVMARHVYCKVAKELFKDVSQAKIGAVVNIDHASVIHALKNVDDVREKREAYQLFCLDRGIKIRS